MFEAFLTLPFPPLPLCYNSYNSYNSTQASVEPLNSAIDREWRTTIKSSHHYASLAAEAGFTAFEYQDGLAMSCPGDRPHDRSGEGAEAEAEAEAEAGAGTGTNQRTEERSFPSSSLFAHFEAGTPLFEALENGSFAVGFISARKKGLEGANRMAEAVEGGATFRDAPS